LLRGRAGPDLRPGTQRQGRRRGATELTPEPTQHLGTVAQLEGVRVGREG
jgi:hypothetical protein